MLALKSEDLVMLCDWARLCAIFDVVTFTFEGAEVVSLLFCCVLQRRKAATRNFFRNEKILFLAKVIALSNFENKYNYIVRANFDRDSPKINYKIYLLLQFLK